MRNKRNWKLIELDKKGKILQKFDSIPRGTYRAICTGVVAGRLLRMNKRYGPLNYIKFIFKALNGKYSGKYFEGVVPGYFASNTKLDVWLNIMGIYCTVDEEIDLNICIGKKLNITVDRTQVREISKIEKKRKVNRKMTEFEKGLNKTEKKMWKAFLDINQDIDNVEWAEMMFSILITKDNVRKKLIRGYLDDIKMVVRG